MAENLTDVERLAALLREADAEFDTLEIVTQIAPEDWARVMAHRLVSRGVRLADAAPWTDQDLDAAATRAAQNLYPAGEGQWNRTLWLREVLRLLGVGAPAGTLPSEATGTEGPSVADLWFDAQLLAREVIDDFGEFALPVGHQDETHEDCLIRAAQRLRAAEWLVSRGVRLDAAPALGAPPVEGPWRVADENARLRAALERTLDAIKRANALLDTLVTREGVGHDAAERIPHTQIILMGALTDLRTLAVLAGVRPT